MNLVIRTIMNRDEVFYAIRFGSWVFTDDGEESQWEWAPEAREDDAANVPEAPETRIF